jgi:hypothetical protein
LEFESVTAGVSPSLSSKTIETFPDFHLGTTSGSCNAKLDASSILDDFSRARLTTGGGVKAEVRSGKLDLGVTIVEYPFLGVTTITVEAAYDVRQSEAPREKKDEHLDGCAVSKESTLDVYTFACVAVVVKGATTGRGRRGRRGRRGGTSTSISRWTFEPNLVVIASGACPNL